MNKEARDSLSPASSGIGASSPTVSDIISLKAQPTEPPTSTLREQNKQVEETLEASDIAVKASTSKETPSDILLEQNATVLVAATKEETKIAIDTLLSL